ncbi:MAG: lipopolysaccharide biosynthesis protein [Polyangiaceae bacterium]
MTPPAGDPRDRLFDTHHLATGELEVERRAARAGRVVGLLQAPRVLLQVVATLVLARLLAPEAFGLVGMVTAVTGFVALFKDLGLAKAVVQREAIAHHEVSLLFWINAGVSLGLAILVAATAPLLARFYGEPRLSGIAVVTSVSLLLGSLGTQHAALLERQLWVDRLQWLEVGALLAGVVVALVTALAGAGYWALVIRSLVSQAVLLVGLVLVTGWWPSAPRRMGGGRKVRGLLRFGADLTGYSLVNYLARNLDDLLVGRFAGDTPASRAAELGAYQKAYDLLLLPLVQLARPIGLVLLPTLSRLQDAPERYRAAYLRGLRLLLAVTMPLVAFLVVTAEEVVIVVLGPPWREAGRLFQVLGLAALTQPVGNTTGWLFVSQGRSREMLRWGIFGATTAVLSFFIGLPWGAYGVAAAYALGSVLVRTPVLLWYLGRSGPVRAGDILRCAAPFWGVALAIGGALLALRRLLPLASPVVVVAVHAGVGVAVALVVLLPMQQGRAALADAWGLLRGSRLSEDRG